MTSCSPVTWPYTPLVGGKTSLGRICGQYYIHDDFEGDTPADSSKMAVDWETVRSHLRAATAWMRRWISVYNWDAINSLWATADDYRQSYSVWERFEGVNYFKNTDTKAVVSLLGVVRLAVLDVNLDPRETRVIHAVRVRHEGKMYKRSPNLENWFESFAVEDAPKGSLIEYTDGTSLRKN